MLQRENAARKSTIFHEVCNVQFKLCMHKKKTTFKVRRQPKANELVIVSQTVLGANKKDPVNETMNPNG